MQSIGLWSFSVSRKEGIEKMKRGKWRGREKKERKDRAWFETTDYLHYWVCIVATP